MGDGVWSVGCGVWGVWPEVLLWYVEHGICEYGIGRKL
jgi:hypothetical protein